MNVEPSLEKLFADKILDQITFYTVCNNHRKHSHGYDNDLNKFPFIRFDIRDQIWKKMPTEDHYELEQRVLENFFEDFGECETEENNGVVDLFFDINGYRLMADLPIYSLITEREALEHDMDNWFDNPDWQEELEDARERIKEIDEELVECAKKWEWVEERVKKMATWFDDYILIEKEGEKNFVPVWEYEDLLKEEGWKKIEC